MKLKEDKIYLGKITIICITEKKMKKKCHTMYSTNVTKIIKTPNITVIVPLYNKALEIRRCIDSILSQTYSDFELIIVDGGSTDGSLEIVRTYTDSRLRIVNQKSKGAAAGRNEGISEASTELIAFLDADDEWMPNFLETIMHLRQKYPIAGMYSTAGQSSLNGKLIVPSKKYGIPAEPWEGVVPDYFGCLARTTDSLVSVSGVAIPKKVFDNIGMFNEKLIWYEDVDLFGRIGYSYPVVYSTKISFIYHISASNKITNQKPIKVQEHPLIIFFNEQPTEVIHTRKDCQQIQEYIEKLHLDLAGAQLLAENPRLARKNLQQIKHNWFNKRKICYQLVSYLPTITIKFIRKHPELKYRLSNRLNTK